MALKNTTTFMRERRENGTPEDLLSYLERIYGDPNVKARAVQRLYALKQKPNQSFERFLPSFERELADAGALQWPDDSKKHTLVMALNKETHSALVNRGVPSTFNEMVYLLHRISADLSGFQAMWNRPKRATAATAQIEETYDPMDWQPTSVKVNRFATDLDPNRDRDLIGKRAKWVSEEERDRRREEGLCIRCGRPKCRIASCPLKPTRRPEDRRHTNKLERKPRNETVSSKKREEVAAVAESSSETESTTVVESSGLEKE
ncbi:retrotransposon gag protein [Penicillium soppii]|uniref:retrotransposon gag protein n=1 Tax=Penicillium soppii TaxID=69789 RepID=UPI0025489415|nr:retrotransposon gag protein [Penicillium soppii]KAJ5874811.1 retrotransposon gag protein [Penicillium soppii]